MFLKLLILLERRCCGISDLSRPQLKYQFGKNLRRRPTLAEYELHKNLGFGWDYQLHKPLLSIMCLSESVKSCRCSALGNAKGEMLQLDCYRRRKGSCISLRRARLCTAINLCYKQVMLESPRARTSAVAGERRE